MRTFAVFVAASRNSGEPPPRLVISTAESISNWPSRSSVHRSDANSARRAPATAAIRNASSADGSIEAAAVITARTSSTVITSRCGTFVERRRAIDATFVDTHPHRTACDSAARSTPCWFLIPGSAMPAARRRVCHRSTSPTDNRLSDSRAIGSFLIDRTLLC